MKQIKTNFTLNYYYKLYGLTIQTAQEILHLVPIKNTKEIDVSIEFRTFESQKKYNSKHEATEIYTSNGLAPNQIPYLTVWKQYENESEFLIIRYTNGENTAFFVSDKNGKNVKVLYHPTIPIDDIYTYFLGPVIGCILRLKSKVCLHASVVNIKGKAIAFIGAKTAGKSTLIANFAAKGYPILSDDIAVLSEKENQYFVELGYPRMRLWKNTVDNLPNIDVSKLQPVLTGIQKYYLPLSSKKQLQWNFQSKTLPLHTVFYLKSRNDNQLLHIQAATPLEGFLKLKQNIYAEYMLETALEKKEFGILGKLANNGIVKQLDRPDDLSKMSDVCKKVIDSVGYIST